VGEGQGPRLDAEILGFLESPDTPGRPGVSSHQPGYALESGWKASRDPRIAIVENMSSTRSHKAIWRLAGLAGI
jgi:hypothetical protein